MTLQMATQFDEHRWRIDNYLPKTGKGKLIDNILTGLHQEQKQISSMFFYDAAGSKLFESITRLPEYYPTRTEIPLIRAAARSISRDFDYTDIVEIGSGDCSKISILLEMIQGRSASGLRYIPIDFSQAAIEKSAAMLSTNFPHIAIHGIVADFMTQLDLIPKGRKRLFCFFGSTIGNLSRAQAMEFFAHIGDIMQPGDRLLLGMDMVKEKQILERAYNDTQGVTATFNRNILKVVNHLLGSNFDPRAFNHMAFYNIVAHRVEMHLKAERDMIVSIPHLPTPLQVRQNETIHTENSHKFTAAHIRSLEENSALKIETQYGDRNQWFSLVQFIKPPGDGQYAGS